MPITSETPPPPPGWGSNWAVAGYRAIRELNEAREKIDDLTWDRNHYQKKAQNHWSDHYASLRKAQVEAADKIRAEAEENQERVANIGRELKASRKKEADKDKQIQQHNSAMQSVNSNANAAVAAANAERQQALIDKGKMSKEKDLNDKQMQMMQKEVERLEGEVSQAQAEAEAIRARVDQAWMKSLHEDGDQLDTDPKWMQVVKENVSLKSKIEENDVTIAELTDELKDALAVVETSKGEGQENDKKSSKETTSDAGNKARSANRGPKRSKSQIADAEEPENKKPKLDSNETRNLSNIEIYSYNTSEDAFQIEKTLSFRLSEKHAFGRLEKYCGDALSSISTGGLITIMKTEDPILPGKFEDMDSHHFQNWVTCIMALNVNGRAVRFFTGVPTEKKAMTKAKATADRVK